MDTDTHWLDSGSETLRAAIERDILAYQQLVRQKLQELTPVVTQRTPEKSPHTHADLVAENLALKEKIASLQPLHADESPRSAPGCRTNDGATSGAFEELFVSFDEWRKLSHKYNEMRKSLEVQLQYNKNSRESRQKVKNDIQNWQEWVEKKNAGFVRREKAIADRERELGIKSTAHAPVRRPSPLQDPDNTGISGTPQGALKADARRVTSISFNTLDETSSRLPATAVDCVQAKKSYTSGVNGKEPLSDQIRSSQTAATEDDEILEAANDTSTKWTNLEDCDNVEVIMERPVKRKRERGRMPLEMGGRKPEIQIQRRIKDEPLSSPPRVTSTKQNLYRTDTLDLDEVDLEVSTPRKRQRIELLRRSQRDSLKAASLRVLKTQRSNSVPRNFVPETSKNSLESDGNDAGSLPEADDIVVKSEDRHHSEPRYAQLFHENLDLPAKPHKQKNLGVLHEISPNTQKRSGGARSYVAKGRFRPDDSGQQIRILSEDGETPLPPRPKQNGGDRKEGSVEVKEKAHQRLHALLEEGTPDRKSLTKNVTPLTSKLLQSSKVKVLSASENEATEQETPGSRQLITPITATRAGHARPQIASSSRQARPSLRSLPLSQLLASDFKPNPKMNHGLDYVFSETARDRESRRCRPGCTKPNCCGNQFRALVEAGARPSLPRGLFESSQDGPYTDAAEEERILRHYLGNAYVPDMTDDYREEMLLRARAKLLADQHGKHRQAFERRSSPPGFWDTEMPDTQQVAQLQERQARQEKLAVEERRREAMRDGGRWLFRDE